MNDNLVDPRTLSQAELSRALHARQPNQRESAAITLVEKAGMLRHRLFVETTVEASTQGNQVHAVIDWEACGKGLHSSGENAVLKIAASIADPDVAVNLATSLNSLDRSNMAAVIKAVEAAGR